MAISKKDYVDVEEYPFYVSVDFKNQPRELRRHREVLNWCRENCEFDFILYCTWQARFQSEADAIAFKLMWG